MKDLITWFQMGGYAAYIWPAYLTVFAVFVLHFLSIKMQTKRVIRRLKRSMK